MAGAYGSLNSRADFVFVLQEALDTAKWFCAQSPKDAVHQQLFVELKLMQQFTASGRAPTDDERDQVHIGLIAVRELGGGEYGDPRIDRWAKQLMELSSFFEGWPTDVEAANAQGDEALRLLKQRTDRKLRKQRSPS